MNAVTYTLRDEKKVVVGETYSVNPYESHELLSLFYKSKILNFKSKITKVVVNAGPGSFTGTRIGIAHAQALSMALQISVKIVNNEKFKKLVSGEINKPSLQIEL